MGKLSASNIKTAVIITNYNSAAKFFKSALEGILAQTIKPTYCVIVDDSSTDESIEVIEKELSNRVKFNQTMRGYWEFNNIKWGLLKTDRNRGAAGARNKGVEWLNGKVDVVFFNDIDDIYKPEKIEKSLEIMLKYPEVGLVYTDYDVLDARTGSKQREYKEIFNYPRLLSNCMISTGSAFSMKILELVGPLDESLRGKEDLDYYLRIAEMAAIYHIPESLFQYTLHGDNITITTPPEEFNRQLYRIQQKIQERQNAKNLK